MFLDNVHSQVLLRAVLRFFKTSFSQPLVPTSKREGVRDSRVWARGGFLGLLNTVNGGLNRGRSDKSLLMLNDKTCSNQLIKVY